MTPSGDPTIRGGNTEENTHTRQGQSKICNRKEEEKGRGGGRDEGRDQEREGGREENKGKQKERVSKRGGHTSGITTTS